MQRITVSHPTDTEIHTQYLILGDRFLNLKYNMPGPGIEPKSPPYQAGMVTTIPPRLSKRYEAGQMWGQTMIKAPQLPIPADYGGVGM